MKVSSVIGQCPKAVSDMELPKFGVIVIKNGVVQNYNEPYGSMMRSVGWTDNVKHYCKDCWVELEDGDPHPYQVQHGKCNQCKYNDNARGVPTNEVTKDCRGNSIYHDLGCEHWCYAFIGDETLTVAFSIHGPIFFVKKEFLYDQDFNSKISNFCSWYTQERSFRDWINIDYRRVEFEIKKLSKDRSCVNVFTMYWNNDFYRVIFGYGIPAYNQEWYTHLGRYYRRGVARHIANYLNRWVKDDGCMYIVDEEMGFTFYFTFKEYDETHYKHFEKYIFDDIDGAKKVFEFYYSLNEGSLDACESLGDIVDCLNYRYGFRKFKLVPWSSTLMKDIEP